MKFQNAECMAKIGQVPEIPVSVACRHVVQQLWQPGPQAEGRCHWRGHLIAIDQQQRKLRKQAGKSMRCMYATTACSICCFEFAADEQRVQVGVQVADGSIVAERTLLTIVALLGAGGRACRSPHEI
jgi:hypothetical protein